MNKPQRKRDQFRLRAGWNLNPPSKPPIVCRLDRKQLQSRLRLMSDSEVDRLLTRAATQGSEEA